MNETLPADFVPVVSSAVGGAVWDLVSRAERAPVLVVHVPDIGKWWATTKAQFDRVFKIEEIDTGGLPVFVETRPGVCRSPVRCSVAVSEPPVSFGMVVLWAGLPADERKVLGARVQERSKGVFRMSVTGGFYRIAGRKNIPQEFQTPWAAYTFLVEIFHGELSSEIGVKPPAALRSFCPW
ncbi:MAG: hypothetical protein Q7U75_16480 [Desulfobacterales bacterium]|nr:hypothetical protein [Desulfobacterales bacterium]